MTPPPTRPVQILQKTYHLPLLRGEQLQELQGRIRQRQRWIKNGKREESGFLGLGKREVSLNANDRFGELNHQIADYKRLIYLITTHKSAYQQFLLQLAAEIRQVFAQKCQQIQRDETERAKDETYAKQRNNPAQLAVLRQEKRELLEELVLLDKAASLMLKKIDLICQGLDRITADKMLQENIVTDLVSDLEVYKRMMNRRQRAEERREDTRRFADTALNFEDYMRRYLGPFQELIDKTAQVDQSMGQTVQEIGVLAEEVIGATANLVNMEELLQLEVVSAEIQDHLGIALERAALEREWAGGGLGLLSDGELDQTSVSTAINQIQGYLDTELGRMQHRFPAVPLNLEPSWMDLDLSQAGKTEVLELPNNGGKLELVLIPAGTLKMEAGHTIKLKEFYMSKYLITQRQYEAVLRKNPSYFTGDPDRPVETVTWHDAVNFCTKLSDDLGKKVNLPSETQWEYACRAGTTTKFWFGNSDRDLPKYAWFSGNSGRTTHSVYEKAKEHTNPWGLVDMSGHLWEWCMDNWATNTKELPKDGTPLLKGGNAGRRAVRGGSWGSASDRCRSGGRVSDYPDDSILNRGFRVVLLLS